MMDTTTGLATISGLLVSLKALVGMAKDVNNIEINGQVIDIQQKVLDIQAKYAELQQENFSLRESNTLLTAKLKRRDEMKHAHGAYWTKDDGPFCQTCWESDEKVIRLSRAHPAPGQPSENDPDAIVTYVCIFHTQVTTGLPVSIAKFRKTLDLKF